MKRIVQILLIFSVITIVANGQNVNVKQKLLNVNNLLVNVSNTGFYNDYNRFVFPLAIKGMYDSRRYLTIEEKFSWAGKIDGKVFFDAKLANYNYQPGYIDNNGNYSDPNAPEAGLFYLPLDLNGYYTEQEYLDLMEHYPVMAGAPWKDMDGDGKFKPEVDAPLITGNAMIWSVGNDDNSEFPQYSRGIEVRVKVFAYDKEPMFNDIVFKEITLVNKSGKKIEDFYFGYFADPDIGNHEDDAVGCQPDVNLAFGYDLDGNDQYYGQLTPVFALQAINPPVNKNGSDRMDNFIIPRINYRIEWDPDMELYPEYYYEFMHGKIFYANIPYFDPISGEDVKYLYEGNPFKGSGRNFTTEDAETFRDIDMQMNFGPYDIQPDGELQVTFALMGVVDTDYKKAIQLVCNYASILQDKYEDLVKPVAVTFYPEEKMPEEFSISSNYPNPFNPVTTIKYGLPVEAKVLAEVYDVLGRRLQVLEDQTKEPGNYELKFNGDQFSSGLYFMRIEINDIVKTIKMTLIK